LESLVELGLVKKAVRNGEERYYADLSYVERAKELMKKGFEIHEALTVLLACHVQSR
jgi:predicted transcriptional regulator with HTH domain